MAEGTNFRGYRSPEIKRNATNMWAWGNKMVIGKALPSHKLPALIPWH